MQDVRLMSTGYDELADIKSIIRDNILTNAIDQSDIFLNPKNDLLLLVTPDNEYALRFNSITIHNMRFDFILLDPDLKSLDVCTENTIVVKITNKLTHKIIYTGLNLDRYCYEIKNNPDLSGLLSLIYFKYIYSNRVKRGLYEYNHYVRPIIEERTGVVLSKLDKWDEHYKHVDSRLFKYGINYISKSYSDIACYCTPIVNFKNDDCVVCSHAGEIYLSTIYGDIHPELLFILTDDFKNKYLNKLEYTTDDFIKPVDNRPSINIRLPIPEPVLKILNKLNIKIHY